jgi:hypothetical protein
MQQALQAVDDHLTLWIVESSAAFFVSMSRRSSSVFSVLLALGCVEDVTELLVHAGGRSDTGLLGRCCLFFD